MEKRINFLENKNAVRAFESSANSKELLFRLFLSDVGLLASMYPDDVQINYVG